MVNILLLLRPYNEILMAQINNIYAQDGEVGFVYPQVIIWSPVVVAGLKSTRNYRCQSSYPLDKIYKKIEDMKIRIKSHQVKIYGKAAENQVYLQVLCWLEDYQGKSCSIIREEKLTERVSLNEFDDHPYDPLELRHILDILDFSWDADLNGQLLEINYELTYNVLAVREQKVSIQTALGIAPLDALLPPGEGDHLEQIAEENRQLRKQMDLYEKNLGSLKRGIKKAESQNNLLNKELGSYKDMVSELREAVRRDQGSPGYEKESAKMAPPEDSLGKKIKRMFLNNQ